MADLIGIVAVDRKGAIGRGGGLPWRFAADIRFFKEQTTGHACLMGRRTWLSLKQPLPQRLNIIMTRGAAIEPPEGVIVLRDKLSVLSLRDYLASDLYVIGGEQLYREFLHEIDRWIVTEIPLVVEDADTFMPKDFLQGFQADDRRQLEEDLIVRFYRRAGGEKI